VTLADATGEVWRSHGKWYSPSVTKRIDSVILTAAAKRATQKVYAQGSSHPVETIQKDVRRLSPPGPCTPG
jgi:hypothetical protein